MRSLRCAYLDATETGRVVEHVPVGDGEVEAAVVVVVEEDGAEPEEAKRGGGHAAGERGVGEEPASEVSVQIVRLHLEVRDGQVEAPSPS